MFNRFETALQIQEGACNPRPIARSLLDAIDACRNEGKNEREDPAVFLILHQLAWVLTRHDIALIGGDEDRYGPAMDACRNHWYNNCPNLEAAFDDELVAFIYKYTYGDLKAELFPTSKDSVNAVSNLIAFAANTINARALRQEGDIAQAITFEALADLSYQALPAKYRSW